ncbi:MAG: MarR family winged helix-turn-helix transcriptional regulator [Chloroflexota bacterium]
MAETAEGGERGQLMTEILGVDKELYWHVQVGNLDEWLHIDVTMPQLKALILIYGSETGSVRMGQMAGALRVAMSTATGIVDRLVEQGLLERQEDPDDRRLVVVRLTDRGYETVERPHRVSQRRMAGVLELLDTDDLRAMARALLAMREAARRARGLQTPGNLPVVTEVAE